MDEQALDSRAVQQAALALGIDCPYVARIVGSRIELHLPSGRVLAWPRQAHYDPPMLLRLDVERLRGLAAHYGIIRRSKMRKAELVEAIVAHIQGETGYYEDCAG